MENFHHRGLTIEYLRVGNGTEIILAFHGFGRHAKDYLVFEQLLLPGQQIISINLFGHGASIFPAERIEREPLTPQEWTEFLEAFLDKLHIDKFHLLGYSMGARVCLSMIEYMGPRIQDVLLLAPDGLKINLLYRFASGTAAGRSIYRSIIDNPSWLFRLAWFLNKIGILNDKLHRFVHVHLDTKEKRILVHDIWLIYKKTFPDLRLTAAKLRDCGIAVHLVFGKYDTVIPLRLAKNLTNLAGDTVSLHFVNAGHRLLTHDTAAFISQRHIWPGSRSWPSTDRH